MNYQQTLNFMFEKLPMYQRIGAAAYKSDLKNTLDLCNLLGNPEKDFCAEHRIQGDSFSWDRIPNRS